MSAADSSTALDSGCESALASLPHAAPFRFVTRILSIDPGVSAKALWLVHGREDFLKGHFPGDPMVPGVLIGEALAQISGIACASNNRQEAPMQGRLAQIDVRFLEIIRPPAEIVLESEVSRSLDGLHRFAVRAMVNDELVARGTLTLALR
jgi:3-hydroxyacyl-[acyl-carrier-protein] dehydratase